MDERESDHIAQFWVTVSIYLLALMLTTMLAGLYGMLYPILDVLLAAVGIVLIFPQYDRVVLWFFKGVFWVD